jgi:hypothetical protein
MAFPNPSIPAPALGLYQLSYGGVIFGGVAAGTPYQLGSAGIGGLDLPGITTGDVKRPLDAGEFAGYDAAEGRDILIGLTIIPDTVSIDHARQTLGGAFGCSANLERPLFVQLPSGTFACMARPRKFNFAVDINTLLAHGTPVNAQLHSTDSRWYSSPSKSVTVSLYGTGTGGGVLFPVTFPAVFGASISPTTFNVWNLGSVEMRPVLVVTGPCSNPTITNTTAPGQPSLTFNVTLAAGDTLTIDTDFQTATLVLAGTTQGSPRENTLSRPLSRWWNLLPANGPDGIEAPNVLVFTAQDASATSATLTVQYADAYPVL